MSGLEHMIWWALIIGSLIAVVILNVAVSK